MVAGIKHNDTEKLDQKQIIYTLNKKKYLLISFERVWTNAEKKIKRLGGIYRGIQDKKSATFVGCGFEVVEYLIPQNKIEEVTKIISRDVRKQNRRTGGEAGE